MKRKIMPIISILVILLLISMNTITFATDRLKEVNNLSSGAGTIAQISGQIIGIIYVIAMIVSITMVLIIGIKYMIAAPDQKASLKARAVPFLIGAILIFGAANILRFIETVTTWFK